MRLRVRHVTRYAYDAPVPYGLQQLRLTPRSGTLQDVLRWELHTDDAAELLGYRDHNGDAVRLVAVEGAREIVLTAEGEVETAEGRAGVLGGHDGPLPLWSFLRPTSLTAPDEAIARLAASIPGTPDAPDWGHALVRTIRDRVAYRIGATEPGTTAAAALAAGHGVCQDHAHLFAAAARSRGLPARYVSGYLTMDDRVDQDATHAWAEMHLPGIGWTGYDVSNGISPDGRYIRLAAGLDYAEAAPVRGTLFGGAGETLTVQVQVQQQQ